MKRAVLILLCISLTACANSSLFSRPAWLHNPFSKSVPGADKTTAETKSNPGHAAWYCYTNTDQSDWQCQEQPAPDLIHATASSRLLAADPQPAPQSAPQPAPQPAVPDATAQTSPTPPPPMPLLKPRPASSEVQTAVSPLDRNTRFIMSHPAEFYTVQLIALESVAEVKEYAATQKIDDPLYTRILIKGKIWVVLLLGIYPDYDAAAEAIKQWSSAHGLQETPWIRKLDALLAAMEGASGDR